VDTLEGSDLEKDLPTSIQVEVGFEDGYRISRKKTQGVLFLYITISGNAVPARYLKDS
jgi:hypothetical protein